MQKEGLYTIYFGRCKLLVTSRLGSLNVVEVKPMPIEVPDKSDVGYETTLVAG